MTEILVGIGLFTAVVLALVALVLAARAALAPRGRIALEVNGTTLQVPAGGRLHEVLVAAGIHLPSACGGVGTCGLCRVRVLRGGGPILPVERAQIARRDASRGGRLACQVPLLEDLVVEVPDTVFGARRWVARLLSERFLTPFIKELVFSLPPGEPLEFRAGAFVQVTCPAYAMRYERLPLPPSVREAWATLGLLERTASSMVPVSRAYSLANPPLEDDRVMLVVRLATPPPGAGPEIPPGVCSSWLFSLQPGDAVQMGGPHGHFFADASEREMVFIGGGVGMAPMRAHILAQLAQEGARRPISFWYGARSARDLFYVELFDDLARTHDNFRWTVALSEPRPDDAWEGPVGFIHEVVRDAYLATHPAPEDCVYYLCGPPVMTRAVIAMLDDLGVEPEHIHFDDFGGG